MGEGVRSTRSTVSTVSTEMCGILLKSTTVEMVGESCK